MSSIPSKLSLASTIKLNNGVAMPRIHLGVYMVSNRECAVAVQAALNAGYRGFDSAEWYHNEAATGHAISSYLMAHSALTRVDVFYTTKLQTNTSYDATRTAIKQSIQACGLGYLDLYLLHSPYGGRQKRRECWRAVEDAVADGEVKSAGVSNFGVKHLEELLESSPRIIPAINQIEVHPFNTRTALTKFCHDHGIIVQAWGPLVRGERMEHHTIASLSRKYSCSPAQLLIRWSLQKEYVPLPKSVNAERIRLNGEIEDVKIGQEDMKVLDGLDEGLVTDWDPTECA